MVIGKVFIHSPIVGRILMAVVGDPGRICLIRRLVLVVPEMAEISRVGMEIVEIFKTNRVSNHFTVFFGHNNSYQKNCASIINQYYWASNK